MAQDSVYLSLMDEDAQRVTPPAAPAAAAPAVQAPKRSIYEDLIDEDQHNSQSALRGSLHQAAAVPPERAVEARRIGQRYGVPPEMVERDFDTYARRDKADKPVGEILAQSPKLAEHLKDPANAKVLQGDLESMGLLEWVVTAPGRAFAQSVARQRYADLRAKEVFGPGTLSREERDQMATWKYQSELGGDLAKVWWKQPITGAGQLLGQQLEAFKYAATGAAMGIPAGLPGVALGFVAGGAYGSFKGTAVLEGIEAYDEISALTDEHGQPMDPTVAKAAAIAVGAINGAIETAVIGKVISRIPYLDRLKGAATKRAMVAALRNPTVRQALFDTAKNFGLEVGQEGVQKLVQIAGQEMVKHLDVTTGPEGQLAPGTVDLYAQPEVKNPDGSVSTVDSVSVGMDGREVLLPRITPDGRRLTTEEAVTAYQQTGQHLGQFSTPQAASAFAEKLHEDYASGRYKANQFRTLGETTKEVVDEMIGAALTFPLGMLPGPLLHVAQASARAKQATQNEAWFTDLAKGISSSDTVKTMPQAAQDFLARATKDGPVETLYAPVDTFTAYWQSKGIDPALMAAELTGDPEAYSRAMADGEAGQLAVPTARYAVRLAGTDHNQFFMQEMRLGDPEAYNLRESKALAEHLDKVIEPLLRPPADGHAPTLEATGPVAEMLKELVRAKVPGQTANDYAQFYRMVTRVAERAGMDPNEVLNVAEQLRVHVEGVSAPAAPVVAPAAIVPHGEATGPVVATFLGHGPGGPLYNVRGGPDELLALGLADNDTKSPAALEALGVAVPPAPPVGERVSGDELRRRALAARQGTGATPPSGVSSQAADAVQERGTAGPAAGPGLPGGAAERGAPGEARVVEGGGQSDRTQRGGVQPAVSAQADADAAFTRGTLDASTARLQKPGVRAEAARLLDELVTFPYAGRRWVWLEGAKTGNAAGGAADIIAGHAGAAVYEDILALAPVNKRRGEAALQVHGTRGQVQAAIERLLETGFIHNNLAEGAMRVAELRAAGLWKGLHPPELPLQGGPVASVEMTDRLDADLDLALQDEANLLEPGALAEEDLLTGPVDTSFDPVAFEGSVFEDLEAPDPVADVLVATSPSMLGRLTDADPALERRATAGQGPGGVERRGTINDPIDVMADIGAAATRMRRENPAIDAEAARMKAQADEAGRIPEPTGEDLDTFAQGPKLKRPPPRGYDQILPHLTPEEARTTARSYMDALVVMFARVPEDIDFQAAARAGSAARGRYSRSMETIAAVFGETDTPRFVALLAALSPQTSVTTNVENAVTLWTNWMEAGRPTRKSSILKIARQSVSGQGLAESVLDSWENNVLRALQSEDPFRIVLSGPKVQSFTRNLLGYMQEVTNDSWMAMFAEVEQRLFRGASRAGLRVKNANYAAMNAKIRRVAEALTQQDRERTGDQTIVWTPAEVQETIWAWTRTLYQLAGKEKRTAVQLIQEGAITDEVIVANADSIASLLVTKPTIRAILEAGGYRAEIAALARSVEAAPARAVGSDRGRAAGGGEAAGGAGPSAIDLRNAARLDRVRVRRAYAKAVEKARKLTPRAFAARLKRRLGPALLAFDLHKTRAGDLKLDMIAVERSAQREGLGGQAMRELASYADLRGERLVLTVGQRDAKWGTTSRGRLVEFYKRFGFVENKGRHADFTISESMWRNPTARPVETIPPAAPAIEEFYQSPVEPGVPMPGPFFSKLQRAVEGATIAKAAGAQWKATIRNAKIGVSKDEFSLASIDDLEDRQSYTKQEVLDYLAANLVTVEDVTLEGQVGPSEEAVRLETDRIYDEEMAQARQAAEEQADEVQFDHISVEARYNEEQGKWEGFAGGEDIGSWFDSEAEALEEANDRADFYVDQQREDYIRDVVADQDELDYEAIEQRVRDRLQTDAEDAHLAVQYADYQLPGGATGSYREVFLTLPRLPIDRNPDITLEAVEEPSVASGRVKAGVNVQMSRYRAIVNGQVWSRKDGTSHLLVFAEDLPKADQLAAAKSAWILNQEQRGWEDGHDAYSAINNPIVRLRFNVRETAEGKRVLFLEELQPPSKENQEKMPPAIIKRWREIALKWALWHAASNDLDLAWTPGQVQVDRYSLEHKVRAIAWAGATQFPGRKDEAHRLVSVVTMEPGRGGKLTIDFHVNQAGVVIDTPDLSSQARPWIGAPLANVLGPSVAESIMKAEEGRLAGEGLRVGGEGLRKLYDVDFKNVVNSLPAVKAAGVKVGTMQIGEGRAIADIDRDMDALLAEAPRFWLDGSPVTAEDMATPDRRATVERVANAPRLTLEQSRRLNALQAERDKAGTVIRDVPSVTMTPALAESILSGQALFQGAPVPPAEGNRGVIRFGPNSQIDIELLRNADYSTFIHETGHLFFRLFGNVTDRLRALDPGTLTAEQQSLLEDYQGILKWMGVERRDQVTREMQEQWADGFEAYAHRGIAPSLELQPAFTRFRTFLLGIYGAIKRLAVPLTPEVIGIMDRMLASDTAIAEAESHRGMQALFLTPAAAGMTPAEWGHYQADIVKAGQQARDRLDQTLMEEVRREQTADWQAKRAAILEQVEAEVWARPVYKALHAMQYGRHPNGDPLSGDLAEDETPQRWALSRAILVQRYGTAVLKALPRPRIYTMDGGLDPGLVAETFGFSSTGELLQAVRTAPPMQAVIDQDVKRRMFEAYGTLLLHGQAMADAAKAAMVDDERERILTQELRALARLRRAHAPLLREVSDRGQAALEQERKERDYERRWFEAEAKLRIAHERGEAQATIDALEDEVRTLRARARGGAATIRAAIPPAAVLRDAARTLVARTPIRQLRPQIYWATAMRAGEAATAHAARQDFDEAILAKQTQLINLARYREAVRVGEEVASRTAYAQGLSRPAARRTIGLAGETYLDQIDGVLDRFEFARVSQKVLDRRSELREWAAALEGQGFSIVGIPSELYDAKRVNYQELTVEEFMGVTDGLKAIAHLARLKVTQLKADDQRAFVEVRDSLEESIRTKSPHHPLPLVFRQKDQWKREAWDWYASHAKLSLLAFTLDGGEDGGLMWEHFIRPLNAASDAKAQRNRVEAARYHAILAKHYTTREQREGLFDEVYIPAIQASLPREAILSLAMNWGTQTGRDRILADPTRQWTRVQVEAILDTLDLRDWRFLEDHWAFLNSFWPEIAAKMKRLTGVEPEKVEALPIQTKFGEMTGGYHPLVYDSRLEPRAGGFEAINDAKLSLAGAYLSSTTRRGFLEKRKDRVKLSVRLDLGATFSHIDQVIHDLTHHEVLINANRLLRDHKIGKAIYETQGHLVYEKFTRMLQDVAMGDRTPGGKPTIADRGARWLRTRSQMAGMAWNLWTAAQQPIGIFNGMAEVGPGWVAKGAARWLRDAVTLEHTVAWIASVSPMMAERTTNATVDLRDLRKILAEPDGWFGKLVRRITRDTVTKETILDSYMAMIGIMQRVADVPTWLGSYEKHMAANPADEARAIALADQAVLDSQGGGNIKDLAEVQRGGELAKAYMVFASYSVTVNSALGKAYQRMGSRSIAEQLQLLTQVATLYVVPALLTETLRCGVGRANCDDPETFLLKVAGQSLTTGLNGIVWAREAAGAVPILFDWDAGPRGYEGPASSRPFQTLYTLGMQLRQGKIDEGLEKAAFQTAGIIWGFPAAQVQRSVDGFVALEEGRTSNPLALLFGPPPKTARR